MKIIILLLFSFSVQANFIPAEKVESCEALTVFRSSGDCQSHYGKDCAKIPRGYNCQTHEFVASRWLKEQVSSCADEADCQSQLEALECQSERFRPIKNLDDLEVYCTKFEPEKVVVDQAKKQAYESAQAEKAADKSAMDSARGRRKCGENVIDRLVVRNGMKKDLSKADIRGVLNAFSGIKNELESGSLDTARDSISNANLSGTVLTEGDRAALIAELDSCKQ